MIDAEDIRKRYNDITQKLSDPGLFSCPQKLEELSKKYRTVKKIMDKAEELEEIKKNILENEEIIKAGEDEGLVVLAEQELADFNAQKKILEEELESLLRAEESEEEKIGPAIMEIRAGTGGEEAALFAGNLFEMYSKYAKKTGWSFNVLSSRESDLGGLKEIIFEIVGNDAFSKMRFESGVHRIQRIPETEKSGRVHTSTATVAVLPKPDGSRQIKINPQDLKIEAFRASGPGGQLVNRRESAVRITHIPTGITVSSQQARTQVQNKEYALKILGARIFAMKEEEERKKIAKTRKEQIGAGERAEKIRTYNFPQDRITDHRIKKNWHNIEKIMDGNLDEIIGDLQKQIK